MIGFLRGQLAATGGCRRCYGAAVEFAVADAVPDLATVDRHPGIGFKAEPEQEEVEDNEIDFGQEDEEEIDLEDLRKKRVPEFGRVTAPKRPSKKGIYKPPPRPTYKPASVHDITFPQPLVSSFSEVQVTLRTHFFKSA